MTQATVIGDVVGSRKEASRATLHARLTTVLERVNAELDPTTPLRVTVGDEYQGCFASVGAAVAATLRLRLWLAPEVEVRHGIGWGAVEVLEESPRVEDGPGWWAARAAIETVSRYEADPSLRRLRTAYERAADVPDGADPAMVNAALMTRDELLAGLAPASLSVLDGMLRDMSQRDLAHDLGVSPSAVSQRIRRDGLAVLAEADRRLGAVR
ncbi:MAG: SatD family protein [Nocardioides sp.]